LSGSMVDAQSKLNVFNLIEAGERSEADFLVFKKLFDHFNLPITELENFVVNLKAALIANSLGTTTLMPQRVRQLTWLGLRPQTLDKLTPYITLLPERTTVNINTAPAEVIYASVPSLELADAKLTVTTRERAHFQNLTDAERAVTALKDKLIGKDMQYSVATRFFEITGRIRLEQTVVEEQSLVQRDLSNNVKTLWRERSVVASPEMMTNNTSVSPKL